MPGGRPRPEYTEQPEPLAFLLLVAAPDDLFFDRASVEKLIEQVVAHFEDNEELDTQTLKAMIGKLEKGSLQ